MIKVKTNYSLRSHNTFGIDVRAKKFIEYSTEADLLSVIAEGAIEPPFLHIGSGSNLLFLKDYSGTILHSKIHDIEIIEEDAKSILLKVGSGIDWDEFVAYTVDQNWYGIENLSLIPGEVGASAVQNIGAYGVEVKDVIARVDTISLEGDKQSFSNSDCNYKYRYSIFKEPENKDLIVTYVYYRLSKVERFKLGYGSIQSALAELGNTTLKSVRSAIIKIREEKLPDPSLIGNAGSFFMNPILDRKHFEEIQNRYPNMPFYEIDADHVKVPAGWMIDVCGWKGKTVGNAGVHDKQALVLVNRGGATGEDVINLSQAIQADVQKEFKVDIHPEVNFI